MRTQGSGVRGLGASSIPRLEPDRYAKTRISSQSDALPLTLLAGVQIVETVATVPVGPHLSRDWSWCGWRRRSASLLEENEERRG